MRETFFDHNFRANSLTVINQANHIITEMAGKGHDLSLRQLYYQFVARALIPNTMRSYKNLGTVITRGREAGLIDWRAIEDRTRSTAIHTFEEDPSLVLYGIEYSLRFDQWKRQDYYVECWVEKEALVGVIERPCNTYKVPYLACKGYLSASEAYNAGKRFELAMSQGKKGVILHLGDHDPSGIDMTRDNKQRTNLYAWASDVEVRRLALNMNQIEEFNPPPNPAKLSDSRAEEYISEHGNNSWELDALDPDVIETLIKDAIGDYIDQDIWDDVDEQQSEGRRLLTKLGDADWEIIKEFLETL